jgi:predicted transcriptional regulator
LDGTERGAWGEERKSGNTRLLESCLWVYTPDMSATEIIEQFKALPAAERAQVAKFVVENDDSWIPESFKQGMADAEAGRLVDLDTALNEPYPGD